MTFIRFPAFLTGLLLSFQVLAFDCYLTLVKDSCWTNYEVTVKVVDSTANKTLLTLTVPKGQSWVRKKFICSPKQKLMYYAQFSPVFWQNQNDKVYSAKRFWFLPDKLGKKDLAWNIPVCFTREFAEVPFPPDAEGSCKCDFDSIPAIQIKGS